METEQILGRFFESVHQKMNRGMFYQDILDSIFTYFDPLVPFDRICIGINENDGHFMRLHWVKSKIPKNSLKKGYIVDLHNSSLGRLLAGNHVRVIEDLEEYTKRHPESEAARMALHDGIKSVLLLPLMSNGKNLGCIFFSSIRSHTYKSKHVDFFDKMSGGLSLVIEQGILKQSMDEFQTKERVFRNTIHDLNNPLFVMKGTLEFATRKEWFEGLSDDSKKTFIVLKRNCEAMINLMRDLNTMHDPDARKQIVYLQKHSLEAFLNEVIEDNESLAIRKNISLKLKAGPNLPCEANVDGHRLREILANLISNAVKFSHPNTQVELQVDYDKINSRLNFSVLDEGQGIPNNELSKLFKEFGKTSIKPTAGEHSTGLGLANVKRIVQYLGGDVSAESQPGEGSRFSFWIPYLD
jgi:signal transduction histidine kinase